MYAEEIIEKLENSRVRLLMLLERLPDEALLEAGLIGDWTVADSLDHLITWESELVTGLMRIDQGKKPIKLLAAFDDIDDYNQSRWTENHGRNLDQIFEDLHGVRRQLESWIVEFNERDLSDANRYEWSKGLPLWHLIKESSFGHEAQHIPDMETFAEHWLSIHSEEPV